MVVDFERLLSSFLNFGEATTLSSIFLLFSNTLQSGSAHLHFNATFLQF